MRIPNPIRLVKAAFHAFDYWRHGYEITVPTKVEVLRLTICERCEFFDPKVRQCNVCTCFVDAKVIVASEHCPKGKWGQEKRKRS